MSDKPVVEVLPIADGATPDPNNINKHTQRGRGLHENSMRKRGAGRSIFSAGKGVDVPVVIGGNQTLEIAASLGMDIINVHTTGNQVVNVVRDDIAPGSPEAIALGIEDNEVGKISYNPDIDILAAVMADPAMQALKEQDRMLADIVEGMGLPKEETKDAEPQIDRAAELAEKWQTATGQLWKLGDHRLLIGDCTVRENVEKLMGGEKACICWTDPPWNVAYGSGFREDNEFLSWKKREIINDNLGDKFGEFADKFCEQIYSVLVPGGILYMAMSAGVGADNGHTRKIQFPLVFYYYMGKRLFSCIP